MLQTISHSVSLLFAFTTFLVLLIFFFIQKKSNVRPVSNAAAKTFFILTGWLMIQALLAWKGVYSNNMESLPPKIFLFGIMPTLFIIAFLFLTNKGKTFMDSLPLEGLTWIHMIRILVEMVLLYLAQQKAIPFLLTFEGVNFDILSGLTAGSIGFYCFNRNYFGGTQIGRIALIIWNFICLGLLLNVVVHAFLSAPTPLQKFTFDQPNIAILYFPFCWLPTFIVPVVLLCHLISLRQLLLNKMNW